MSRASGPTKTATVVETNRIEALIQNGVNAIWQHTRENKDSLESERHCNLIRKVIDDAVAASVAFVSERVESQASALGGLRTQNKEQKARIAQLEKQIERLRDEAQE